MKRIVASVGLLALGTSALHAAPIPNIGAEAPKPWNVAVTLRGFYDDNINTVSSGKVSAFGYEVSPTVGFNFSLPQTSIRFGYTYSLKYYDHQPAGNTDHFDQTHIFNFALDHAFSERYRLGVRDSFVIGQEPDTLRAGNTPLSSFQRIPGNNIRNTGSIVFNAQLTPLFGLELGYANSLFDYKDSGAFLPSTALGDAPNGVIGGVPVDLVEPSLSGVLDRMEHTVHLDTRWTIAPETTFIVGAQAREIDYTGGELIQGALSAADGTVIIPLANSDSRNLREYSGYVGAEHAFLPNLSASARVGASYVDYYNSVGGNGNSVSPYASGSLRWTYSQDNVLELGVSHDVNATDVTGQFNRRATLSAESTVIYANIIHHITPFLTASGVAQFQNSSLNGGDFDGKSERFFLAGINLEYKFNRNFSANAGYNYDKLDSEIANRSFDRNRVYIGLTAGY